MTKKAIRWAVIVLALIGLSSVAAAQTFTFTTTSSDQTQIGMAPGTGPGGSTWTSEGTVTFADGTVDTTTASCLSMSQPPNDTIFAMHGLCDGSGAMGGWTSIMGCNPMNDDSGRMTCVGGLYGTSGELEGRSGGFNLIIQAGDGGAQGTGQWYD